jgi:hypothetical protein
MKSHEDSHMSGGCNCTPSGQQLLTLQVTGRLYRGDRPISPEVPCPQLHTGPGEHPAHANT